MSGKRVRVSSGSPMRCDLMGLLLVALLAIVPSLTNCARVGDVAEDAVHGSFKVYFNNDRLAADPTDCSAVFPVNRFLPGTSTLAPSALRSLFRGPSSQERGEGYRSFFSESTAGLLRRLRVEAGTAYLDLYDMRQALSGASSSCGSAEFQSQIERTLLQFSTIERVRYAIDGDPRTFYEWVNEPCGRANDDCNPAPFRIGH